MKASSDEKHNQLQKKGVDLNGPSPQLKDLSVPELMEQLGSSQKGLSESEAKDRLVKYGYNELAEKK